MEELTEGYATVAATNTLRRHTREVILDRVTRPDPISAEVWANMLNQTPRARILREESEKEASEKKGKCFSLWNAERGNVK